VAGAGQADFLRAALRRCRETETAADRTPVALGVNFTLMKQLAPDATLGAAGIGLAEVVLRSQPTIVMLVMLDGRVTLVAERDRFSAGSWC